ncbi:MAG: tetratricopeptide repeat protein, partial [Schwartzia sp.]|nr:tetratricopeptide repeat protein [Schwartzia sp. (in: firmicutes)]
MEKQYQKKGFPRIIGMIFALCVALLTFAPVVSAAVSSYSSIGEYMAVNGETPPVAEERAFLHAKQNAARQAVSYVEMYAKGANARITKDRSFAVAWNSLRETQRIVQKNGNQIVVELSASIDDADIDFALGRPAKAQVKATLLVAELQRSAARLEQEMTAWKNSFAEGGERKRRTEEDEAFIKEQETKFLVERALDRSCRAYEKQEYGEMRAACEEAFRLDYKSPGAYTHRGVLYEEEGNLDKALAEYTRAIAEDMNFAAAYELRGIFYVEKAQYERAVSDMNKASAIAPESAAAYYYRGFAYLGTKKYRKAVADFTSAVAVSPDYGEVYAGRGKAYLGLGQYDKAIADCTRAIALLPNAAEVYKDRAAAQYVKKRFDRAVEDYTRALAIVPDDAEAFANRGGAYAEKKRQDLAIADYTRALEIDPKFVA